MIDEKLIDEAVDIIRNSERIVFFTGAGHSTESGIEDFRSPGGIWDRYDPSIYASYQFFLRDPSKFWSLHKELEKIMQNVEPNPGHYAIAELEKMGKVSAIITQNIDMLHQRAGSGSYKNIPIYELHGSYGKLECVKCHTISNIEDVDYHSVDYPVCNCGGYIKPRVVLFGEALPTGVLEGAMRMAANCDCFILVGSSLQVSPANFMPSIAKENGAKTIFINKEPTAMNHLADLFLETMSAPVLSKIIEKLR
ncbi:MAG: NAD-dependent deacylase [Candidatus Lokiarchaeota archaeon]|nr:NAD-dependent deacylase [Candidatus Lokiarchaeota archaeon]